jgi:hypothetical protein
MSTRFDRLIEAVLNEEISVAQALEQARSPAIYAELDINVVAAIGNNARRTAQGGNWRDAVKTWPVLLSAVTASTGPDDYIRGQIAVADWVFVVTEALKDIPDARLLQDAALHGDRAISIARAVDDQYWVGTQAQRLGALYLLPYVALFREGRLEVSLKRWKLRLLDEYNGVIPLGSEMPDPLTSFRLATRYLELSLVAQPHDGFTYKILADALHLRHLLNDDTVEPARIREVADHALELLPEDVRDWRLEMTSVAAKFGGPVDTAAVIAQIEAAQAKDLDDNAGMLLEKLAVLRVVVSTDPSRAIEFAEDLWRLASAADERYRQELAERVNDFDTAGFGI